MRFLLNDLQYAYRQLRKSPASTGISIFTLGFGIALCTMMFSAVYGIHFRNIGVPEADRLVLIYRTNPSRNIQSMRTSPHDFYDWREQQSAFEALAGFTIGSINLGDNDDPRKYNGGIVSANLFDLLRVPPVLGTTFREGDD